MGHLPASAVHCGGLRSRPHQSTPARPEQSRLLHPERATNTKGFEAGLVGYITDQWQVSGGYAYTDAKIVSATSTTIVPGNRVGLVPYHAFTLWNKYEIVDWFALGAGIIHQTD